MEDFSRNLVPIVPGPTKRYAQWPPAVEDVQTLGYLVDGDGKNYPRDIGRSSVLAGDVIVQFGDTFENDEDNNFVTSVSSSVALIMYPRSTPTVTSYAFDQAGHVEAFIPILPTEIAGIHQRATLWCFGGIIEIGEQVGGIAAGWVFYQKGTHYSHPSIAHKYEYTGVAKIYYDLHQKKITVNRIKNPLIMFQDTEPRFGTFSTIVKEDYAYLFGHAHKSWKVMLARVNTKCVLDRSQYTYWDGKKYQTQLGKARAIIDDVQQGMIYRSKLFEPNKGRDWVFVGCSRFKDNQVLMGVSGNIEGPYTKVTLMATFPLPPMPEEPFRYCVYPHPWAFNEEGGEMMITWSEGSINGNVVAVKVQLAMTMEVGQPGVGMSTEDVKKTACCVVS